MHAKTGASSGYGWFVGWATQSGRTVAFARLVRNDASKLEGMSDGEWSREGLLREFPTLIPPLLK